MVKGILFTGFLCLIGVTELRAQEVKLQQSKKVLELRDLLSTSSDFEQNSLDSSLYYNERAMQIARELEIDTLTALVLMRRGTLRIKTGEMESAKTDYRRAASLYRKSGSPEQYNEALYNLGYYHYYQKQYDSSLYYFTTVRKFYEDGENLKALGATDIGIGTHYYYFKNDYRNALKHFLSAAESFDLIENPEGEAGARIFAGLAYIKMDILDSAELLFRQSLEITGSFGLEARHVESLSYLATVLKRKGEYLSAFRNTRTALEMAQRIGLRQQQARLEASMVDLILDGDSSTTIMETEKQSFLKTYGGMMSFLFHAENYVMEYGMLHSQINLLKYLSDYYAGRGEFETALDYRDQYHALQDSIQRKVKIEAIAAIEEQYETAEKEKQLIAARAEMDRITSEQKMERLYYGGAISVMLLLGVATFFYARMNRANAQRKQKAWQLAQAEAQAEKSEKEHFQRELDLREREVAAHALNIVRKNELIARIQEQLKNIKDPDAAGIKRTLNNNWVKDKDWEHFNQSFNSMHPSFYDELHKLNPKLTNRDLRLAALIRLRMNNRDISNLLGINITSVDQARYRLKKKLNLENHQNLESFIGNFSEKVA